MIKFIGRRLALIVPLAFVIASLAFFLIKLMPADIASTILGETATAEQRAALRDQLGLDRPVLAQYGDFLATLFSGSLGNSLTNGQPVIDQIAQRLPVTLTLAVGATILCVIIGITLGTLAATRGGILDSVIRGAASAFLAIPGFWLAVLLVFVFAVTLHWFPSVGWVPFATDPLEWLNHLALPLLAIVLGATSSIARQTRVAMLANLDMDYVATLRAAGLPEWRVVWIHALRNSAIPVLTSVGLQFVGIFGGVVLVEQVFALPGIGQLALVSTTTGDVTVITGVVIVTSLVILTMNLLVDIVYAIVNPKARTV